MMKYGKAKGFHLFCFCVYEKEASWGCAEKTAGHHHFLMQFHWAEKVAICVMQILNVEVAICHSDIIGQEVGCTKVL